VELQRAQPVEQATVQPPLVFVNKYPDEHWVQTFPLAIDPAGVDPVHQAQPAGAGVEH